MDSFGIIYALWPIEMRFERNWPTYIRGFILLLLTLKGSPYYIKSMSNY